MLGLFGPGNRHINADRTALTCNYDRITLLTVQPGYSGQTPFLSLINTGIVHCYFQHLLQRDPERNTVVVLLVQLIECHTAAIVYAPDMIHLNVDFPDDQSGTAFSLGFHRFKRQIKSIPSHEWQREPVQTQTVPASDRWVLHQHDRIYRTLHACHFSILVIDEESHLGGFEIVVPCPYRDCNRQILRVIPFRWQVRGHTDRHPAPEQRYAEKIEHQKNSQWRVFDSCLHFSPGSILHQVTIEYEP
jgi:hypothetical protein